MYNLKYNKIWNIRLSDVVSVAKRCREWVMTPIL